jgi:hypothetical protein
MGLLIQPTSRSCIDMKYVYTLCIHIHFHYNGSFVHWMLVILTLLPYFMSSYKNLLQLRFFQMKLFYNAVNIALMWCSIKMTGFVRWTWAYWYWGLKSVYFTRPWFLFPPLPIFLKNKYMLMRSPCCLCRLWNYSVNTFPRSKCTPNIRIILLLFIFNSKWVFTRWQ